MFEVICKGKGDDVRELQACTDLRSPPAANNPVADVGH